MIYGKAFFGVFLVIILFMVRKYIWLYQKLQCIQDCNYYHVCSMLILLGINHYPYYPFQDNEKNAGFGPTGQVKNFMQPNRSTKKRFCDHYGGMPFFGWIWALEIIFGHFFLSIFKNLKIECQKMPYQHKCPTWPSEQTYQTINDKT